METLSDRQKFILNAVVDSHIDSALPVSSRLVTRDFDLGYSAATIRHEMGALEERGFLMHPHTSSGRLPTDSGYRYYVDNCLGEDNRDPECESVRDHLQEVPREGSLDAYGENISRVLSAFSQEVGILLTRPMVARAPEKTERLFVRGSAHIFDKPEFKDSDKAKELFCAFEESDELSHLLNEETQEGDVTIRIGQENSLKALWDCSVVSTRYDGGDGSLVLAVLGPRRMRYSRVKTLITEISNYLKS